MRSLLMIAALLLVFAVPTAPVALAAGDPPTAAPSDPDYDAGKKAIESKNWKSALDYFGRAAARDPGNADIHNYLGYAYRKSGNLDAAFKSYAEALRLDPKHKGANMWVKPTCWSTTCPRPRSTSPRSTRSVFLVVKSIAT